jgi:hypothetical protein
MPEETKEHTEVKASPAPAAAAVTTAPVAGIGGGSGESAKTDAAKSEAGKSAAAEARTVSIGDDEYDVDEGGYVKIPATAFKKRLNRYTKAQLKEAFGTDNVEDIKLRLDEHGKLKAKADEDHKKTLATEERLQLERDNEKKLRIAAESKAEALAEEREYREADHSVNETASRHVDAKFTDFAAYKFGCYVRELDDDEADAIKPKDVASWFKQFAADHPEYAIGAKPAAAADDKPKVKKPMEHGAGGGVAPPPAPASGGKTPRPGQPNSMSAEEYRQWKKDQGIRA